MVDSFNLYASSVNNNKFFLINLESNMINFSIFQGLGFLQVCRHRFWVGFCSAVAAVKGLGGQGLEKNVGHHGWPKKKILGFE